MQDLNIAFLQTDLVWEDPAANHRQLEQKIDSLDDDTDLVILPEMFNTGFTVAPELHFETDDGLSVQWMKDISSRKGFALMGSLIVKERNNYYNRLYFIRPDGPSSHYDKRHLFRMGKEHLRFSAGEKKNVVDFKGWRIMPMVCYDLRFPVWSKNTMVDGRHEYDLLVYVANWPAARAFAWKSLLIARAIENQAYVVGVNRIGKDGKNINYSGDSMAVDPQGKLLVHATEGEDEKYSIKLSATDLIKIRNDFQVGLDWDQFILYIRNV